MPIYTGLISVNVTLLLRIATKSLLKIFCNMGLGFDVHSK